MTHVVVDGANVVGSRPDGWWRDRAGAAERLAAELATALDTGVLDAGLLDAGLLDAGLLDTGLLGTGVHGDDITLHLVVEGAARAADPPAHPRLHVVRADDDGDDDDATVALTRDLGGHGVVVVTADRGLRERVRALGATCTGPATLFAALLGRGGRP
ncbi:hypothetical protein [Pseudonocardia abyssalis]|uniref:NYN domain-containing protein n=1 Tax=Pseudonocardia abyssalis TaxID=2792008 RepID=A0ABS6UPX1_9PSEU|nr:hypothetical protein [Pseudonocardia abyssalis]MBW0119360.1 hypothetical protein [Pseudonocardia abyssalis]MBW0134301.1 hypothetical protein [Pseudonocardia abyssalis]